MPLSVFSRRGAARAALVVLITLTALTAHPTWARSLGVDVWNLPALQRELRTTVDERARLEAANDVIHRRVAVRQAIAAELVAERITLTEAVARFSDGMMTPEQMMYLRIQHPGEVDEELVARVVIAYALDRVAPEERPAATRRWQDELDQAVAAR